MAYTSRACAHVPSIQPHYNQPRGMAKDNANDPSLYHVAGNSEIVPQASLYPSVPPPATLTILLAPIIPPSVNDNIPRFPQPLT